MAAPYSSLQDKLDRAICAYLIAAGLGGTESIVPALQSAGRTVGADGLTTVRSDDGREEWLGTGNYRFNVTVELKYPAVLHPDETNVQAQMVLARRRQAVINDALLLGEAGDVTLGYTRSQINVAGRALAVSDGSAEGDLSAANNADMVDFTCIAWQEVGFSSPSQEANFFVSTASFDAIACAKNID